MIVLATAHAAKFPDAVKRATGRVPELPERLQAKLGQQERLTVAAQRLRRRGGLHRGHARAGPAKSVKLARAEGARERRSCQNLPMASPS